MSLADWLKEEEQSAPPPGWLTVPERLPERWKAQAQVSGGLAPYAAAAGLAAPYGAYKMGERMLQLAKMLPEIMRNPEAYPQEMFELAGFGVVGGAPGGYYGRGTALGQIRAYHGSPHKFKKFSMSKIGTGEGAQAFGHGLYFTNLKDIAKHYAPGPQFQIGGKPVFNSWINTAVRALEKDKVSVTIKNVENRLLAIKKESMRLGKPWEAENIDIALGNVKTPGASISESGQLYKVTLHKGKKPSEYDYLKWDKNYTPEQGRKIAKQFEKEKPINEWEWWAKDVRRGKASSAKELYKDMSTVLGSDKEASMFLLRAGIDGIEYPAGTLSGVKSAAKNYVVFDESAITIE